AACGDYGRGPHPRAAGRAPRAPDGQREPRSAPARPAGAGREGMSATAATVAAMALADIRALVAQAAARAIAPRRHTTVSEWSAQHRVLSRKASPEPGPWRNDRNPPLIEPMNCMSARSPVRDIVCMFPIQFGKTEIALNAL